MHPTRNEGNPAGYAAARFYKYCRQFTNPNLIRAVPESRIAANVLYRKHRGVFDSVSAFFSKYGMDLEKYLRFAAEELQIRDEDLDSSLMSKSSLNKFAEKLAAEENRLKVYGWYSRTVEVLADSCLRSECPSTADFIRKLIRDGRLAAWVVAGKISIYYLAAIPGFPKIVEKLDGISRSELSQLSGRYDMYNTVANEAVLAFRKRKANPIRDTDEMIEKLRREKRPTEILFDPSLDS